MTLRKAVCLKTWKWLIKGYKNMKQGSKSARFASKKWIKTANVVTR